MPDRTPFDAPDGPDVDPDLARRLTAAFGALATGEVPDRAPRPAHAPRPAAATGGSTRRRWTIAGGSLLVAAAAVVLALLLGTEVFDARVATTAPPATDVTTPSSPPTAATTAPPASTVAATTTPPSTTTSAATPPDAATVAAAFAAVSNGTRSDVVTVPGGYEGADLTGGTTIRFFTSADGTTWQQAGTSTYPPLFAASGQPASIKVAGLPTGAPHAVFVVADQDATGDGTGVDVAFSDGANGFGAVKGGADGDLRPSGSGVDAPGAIGGSYAEDLRGGQFVTVECSTTVANALCGEPANQITKYWSWSGDAYVLERRTGPAS